MSQIFAALTASIVDVKLDAELHGWARAMSALMERPATGMRTSTTIPRVMLRETPKF
jgi:hypothetical protein